MESLDFGGEFEAGELGHLDIGEQNVGQQGASEVERGAAVGGIARDFEIAFSGEQGGERAAHHGLIFGDEDADHTGTRMRSSVPCEPWRSRMPPSASTRSRMPLRPLPSSAAPQRPLSAT